ncbi:TusE/DsrC/DsvC family sulfur relay protein [Desulfosediminicola flagellatus]|uniref:TusE/DsrC/DsvC family sulfur relay protein n=1 Tax=Desulfosediminicola flagellatus TaxID=2569541 RepID=UPI0010AB6363|nr:TusE/DsrC/DsvC family sulfur relay protein [Desulfosediminicola flagellatus]
MKDPRYTIEVNGKEYTITNNNQLSDIDAWDGDILNWLAEKADISLQDEHHTALQYIRATYKERQRYPVVRLVAAQIAKKHGAEKGTPQYFYNLFPKGVQQASTLAGVPLKELCF